MGLCIGLAGMACWGWQQEGSQAGLMWPQAAFLAPGSDGFCCSPRGLGAEGSRAWQVPAELSPCSPQAH